MTTSTTKKCTTCNGDIKFVTYSYTKAGFEHVDPAVADHTPYPIKTCNKCGATGPEYRESAWGYSWNCQACGHHEYHSIGD